MQLSEITTYLFIFIAGYLWITTPPNYDTRKYHADYWRIILGQIKNIFAEIKAGKHKSLSTQWAAFCLMVLLAGLVIFLITAVAYWLKP